MTNPQNQPKSNGLGGAVVEFPQPHSKKTQTATEAVCPHFITRADGVYYIGMTKEGLPLPEKQICSHLDVIAKTAGEEGNHGILLKWTERKGSRTITQRWAVPRKHMLGDGLDFLRELEDKGVIIQVGQERKVLEYLRSFGTDRFITSVSTVGWNGDDTPVFVTPTRIYGAQADNFIYQPDHKPNHRMGEAGTLEEWQDNVAALAAGNSRLVFAISAAFAGSLLNLANSMVDGGGIHFHGASSVGKSITLAVAASVWGRGGKVDNPKTFIRKWASTAVGVEIAATLHNDLCLLLDEIGECDEKQAAKIPYMLGNGAGKERGDKSVTSRPMNTFRLMFLSNGEHTLEDHLKQKGIKVAAGQELRMLNIPADAGQGMGIVETLHNYNTSRELVEYLVSVTTQYYGVAGSEWLKYITQHTEQLRESIPQSIRQFKTNVVPESAAGQVHRAANRFALVAIAGELATKAGITGWTEGEATKAATRCFNDWLVDFGGANGENREQAKMLDTVQAFIERNGVKFIDLSYESPTLVPDLVGFLKTKDGVVLEYWVLAKQFERLCEGFNAKNVVSALYNAGWMQEPVSQNKRLPLLGQKKVYVIKIPD